MTRLPVRTGLLLLGVLVMLLAVPAAASATDAPSEEAPAPAEFTGDEPAVVLEDAAPADEEPAWTFRFLVPTVLAIAVAGVVATIAVYALRIRGRYRVVP